MEDERRKFEVFHPFPSRIQTPYNRAWVLIFLPICDKLDLIINTKRGTQNGSSHLQQQGFSS